MMKKMRMSLRMITMMRSRTKKRCGVGVQVGESRRKQIEKTSGTCLRRQRYLVCNQRYGGVVGIDVTEIPMRMMLRSIVVAQGGILATDKALRGERRRVLFRCW